MIARMPVRSETSSSERSKPRRLSISSWLRIRSAASAAGSFQPAAPGAASAPGAGAGSGAGWVSSDMAASTQPGPVAGLVDQHLLDEHGVGAGRRDDQVHAAKDLHAQLVRALAAREVLRPQL